MKVNLLQGTCTPTLTPMPGVHQPLQVTRPLWRFRMNVKGNVFGSAPLSTALNSEDVSEKEETHNPENQQNSDSDTDRPPCSLCLIFKVLHTSEMRQFTGSYLSDRPAFAFPVLLAPEN